LPLFDDGGYPANATAIEETLRFSLHKDDFRRFCEQHPRVPLKVLAVVGASDCGRWLQLIETVTFGSVRQRLARVLLEAAKTDVAGAPKEIPLTHEELAARLAPCARW